MGTGAISNSGSGSINITGKLVGNIINGLDEKSSASLFEKLNSKQTDDLIKCICDTAVLAAEKIGEKIEESNEKLIAIIRGLIKESLSVIENARDGSLCTEEFEDLKTHISGLLTQESFYTGLQLYSEKIIQAFELNLWKETIAAVEALHEEINADYPDSERIEAECDNVLKKVNVTTDQKEFARFCKIVCGKGTTNSKRKNLLKQKPSLKCVSYVEDVLLCAITFAKRETIILTDGYLGMCENIYEDCGINFGKLHEQLNRIKENLDNSVFFPRDNDVFIMYSSQDCATVNEIYNGLDALGIKCFCAAINVRRNSGKNYSSTIEAAMKRCKALLFVSSKISRKSSDDIADECNWWQQKTLDEYRGIDSSVTHYRDVDAQYNVRFHCVIDGAVDRLEAGLKETLRGIDYIYYSAEDIENLVQLIRSGIMERDNYCYQKKFYKTLELGIERETKKMEETVDVGKKSATTEPTVEIQFENDNNPEMEDFEIEGGVLKRYCGEGGEVVIPDSVKSIGPFALGAIGTEIEKIVIPAGVVQIDYLAFGDCELLSQIIVSAENKSFCDIDGVLFDKGKKRIIKYPNGREEKEYSIPDGVTAIGQRAFNSCRHLTKIFIPDSVTVIEKAPDGALGEFCPQEILNSVSVNTLLTLSVDAFVGCGSLSNIIVSGGNSKFCDIDGVLFNKAKSQIIKYPRGRADKRYTILDGVTSIGEYAFNGCEGLEGITIPDSVTSIGEHAFYGCRWLEIINFNGSESQWKTIEKDEDWDAEAFEFDVTFSDKKPNKNGEVVNMEKQTPSVKASPLEDFKIENEVLRKYKGEGGDVVIPDGVTSIGSFVLCGGGSLFDRHIPNMRVTSITIPSSVTNIGNYAFYGCCSLTSITIPSSVTSIGERAFFGCSLLTRIEIPNSVASIGEAAFAACKNLTSVSMSEKLKKCIEMAFKEEAKHIKFEFYEDAPVIYNRSLDDYPTLESYDKTEFEIKDGVLVKCKGKDCNVVIPKGVTSIGDGAFIGCKSLTNIIIPEGVTSIKEKAFLGCSSLTRIEIPDSVTNIEKMAFLCCSSLTRIEIPDSVTSIEEMAFACCSSLTNIIISKEVTRISVSSFAFCKALTNIKVESENSEYCDIDGILFSKDKTVLISYPAGKTEQYYIIPSSVTCIGPLAFGGCKSLNHIVIPECVISIGGAAFECCSSLASIEIPKWVIDIGTEAFVDCSSLTSIVIPKWVISIGDAAFGRCGALTDIKVESENSEYCDIDGVLFNKDKTILISYPAGKTEQSYVIPSSVTSIKERAFFGCSSLTRIEIPNSVASIGEAAFAACINLTSVSIQEELKKYIELAFKEEAKHIKFDFYENSITDKDSDDYPTLVNYDKTVFRVEGTVLKKYLGKKQDVQIPRGITELDHNVFKWCHFLKSVFIPDSLKIIGAFAFSWCGLLSDVVLPDGVTEIHLNAFAHCRSLKSIFIPKSVKIMDSYVFSSCNKDLAIYCETEQKPQGWNKSWNYDNYQVYWGSKREDADI